MQPGDNPPQGSGGYMNPNLAAKPNQMQPGPPPVGQFQAQGQPQYRGPPGPPAVGGNIFPAPPMQGSSGPVPPQPQLGMGSPAGPPPSQYKAPPAPAPAPAPPKTGEARPAAGAASGTAGKRRYQLLNYDEAPAAVPSEGGVGGGQQVPVAQFGAMGLQPQQQQQQQQGMAAPVQGRPVPAMEPSQPQQQQVQPQAQLPQAPAQQYVAQTQDRDMFGDVRPLDPRYIRLTTNACPNSSSILSKWAVPFGAIIKPFAEPDEGVTIPCQNFHQVGPVRCDVCRAYINAYVQFEDGGRGWRCNFCNNKNEVHPEYFYTVDINGRRHDRENRPELSAAVYDLVASQEYMVRGPQPATYVFVIDVSTNAVSSGLLKTVTKTIKDTLDSLPGDERTNVAIITFDSAVHFYKLRGDFSQPQMFVVSNVDEVFLPMPSAEFLVSLEESRRLVDQLLDSLPAMFADTHESDCAYGPALLGGGRMMSHVGGKMTAFLTGLPNVGAGALTDRQNLKPTSARTMPEFDTSTLNPASSFYKNLAVECSQQQICIDTFYCGGTFQDLASLFPLSRYTCGSMHQYPGFVAGADGAKLSHDLVRCLTRHVGLESVLRVRCTHGVRIDHHYGNLFIRQAGLLSLANADADKAFGCVFQFDDSVLTGKYFYLQAGMLHTTVDGERRIRVLTSRIPIVNNQLDLFRNADVECITALMAKQAVEWVGDQKLPDLRRNIVNSVVKLLANYRVVHEPNTTQQLQLLLPTALKLLPLYILALLKTSFLRLAVPTTADERVLCMSRLNANDIPSIMGLLYPRCYALHKMEAKHGLPTGEDATGPVAMPPIHRLSAQYLEAGGIHLLEDTQKIYIWVGSAVKLEVVSDYLAFNGTEEQIPSGNYEVLPSTAQSKRVCNIIDYLRKDRNAYMPTVVLRQNSGLDFIFNNFMVEDRLAGKLSYYDFIAQIHKEIQSKVPW